MGLLKKLGEIVLLHVAALGFMALAPLLYLTVPFILIALNPNVNFGVLALIYMALGPFAASFWMIITRMISRYRRLTADGTPYERSLEGVVVACGWMVVWVPRLTCRRSAFPLRIPRPSRRQQVGLGVVVRRGSVRDLLSSTSGLGVAEAPVSKTSRQFYKEE
jgi:hypothetical protein